MKGGGKQIRVSLSEIQVAAAIDEDDLLALDDAIRRLRDMDPSAAEVVTLRFFAGLSVAETAQTLAVSETTVKRQWAFARAWLFNALGGSPGQAPGNER